MWVLLTVWSTLFRGMIHDIRIRPQLREAIQAFTREFSVHQRLAMVVRYFTAHYKHDRSKIILVAHVTEKIANLWFALKDHIFEIGGSQFIGTPTRGPDFRTINDYLRNNQAP